MSELIVISPGHRSLTPRGYQAVTIALESSYFFEDDKPTFRLSRDAAEIIREVSELRKRDWKTTTRWNPEADFVGWLGEIATQSCLGLTPEAIISAFLNGLKGSDGGHDVVVDGLKLDVKATKAEALRIKFSKSNRFTKLADGFIFTQVEFGGLETRVKLHGWATRSAIKPHQRDDGDRYIVRVGTLEREGVLRPMRELKAMKSQEAK